MEIKTISFHNKFITFCEAFETSCVQTSSAKSPRKTYSNRYLLESATIEGQFPYYVSCIAAGSSIICSLQLIYIETTSWECYCEDSALKTGRL